jgi:mRNA interferase HigB
MIKAALCRWLALKKTCTASSFVELRQVFNGVDQVKVGSDKTVCVFDLGGKKSAHRLIVAIHFSTQIVFVLRLLAHAEYDKETWKNEL